MAQTAIAAAAPAVLITAPAGSLAQASAACQLGITQAGAATGPSVNGLFTWPGSGVAVPTQIPGNVSLYVFSTAGANLNTES